MHFDKAIMNPPYTQKVEQGRKRALDLDFPIYQEAVKHGDDIVCLMRRSMKTKKNAYTDYWEKDKNENEIIFPGVSIPVSIYRYEKNKKPIYIKSKYEENGKLDWIKKHDISGTGKSLWDIIDRDYKKFKTGSPVPKNYVALSEVCGKNFTIFTEGEIPLKKNGDPMRMMIYIKTNNTKKMKEWLLNVVNPLHNKFVEKYGDLNIDRGFSRTVEVPEYLRR